MASWPERIFGYEKNKPPVTALKKEKAGGIMNAASQIKGGTRMIRYVITA